MRKKKAKGRRKFWLVDLEEGPEKGKVTPITMKQIVDHFVGDGSGCVRWNKNNVDLDRFKDEMLEIDYEFHWEFVPFKNKEKK